ncbi:MAG: acyltransferase [Deltaproteobacteria bacterium]|nr:acyltransferase [Deltaproteobacteria bacterium]
MNPRGLAKALVRAVASGTVAPLVAAYRLELAVSPGDRRDPVFQSYSQALGLVPGLTGQFLRRAFYGAVLTRCDPASLINWGTVFSSADVTISEGVYIGARCMIGRAVLEPHVTIGSNVDILSGKNQHNFEDPDKPLQQQGGRFERVRIGTNSWLGNGSIVLADVGARCVVAAGAVVVNDLPDDVIVGGNPARVLKRRDPATGQWVKP